MTESEIKSALFCFHSANENLLCAFLVNAQVIERDASDGKSKVDIDLADKQVTEIMAYLAAGGISIE